MRSFVFLAVLAAMLTPAIASAESPAEKQLAQKIGSHLKQSGELRNYRVGVKFHDGVAYLSGSVTSAEQRDSAVRLAQQVDGVTHVVSKLEYPTEGDRVASSIEPGLASKSNEPSNELDRASFEPQNQNGSGVMQAYEQQQRNQGAKMLLPNQQVPQNRMSPPMARRKPAQGRQANMPVPFRPMPGVMPNRQAMQPGMQPGVQQASCNTCGPGGMASGMGGMGGGEPAPMGFVPGGSGRGPAYDNPQMPGYSWPSYASYPNYAAVTYPQQYSPTAWPYIGPFYPYPQVPLAWRKVSLEWDDGWWFLDFSAHNSSH